MPTESAKNLVEQGISRTRGDDRSLSALAKRQYGVVGRRQLISQGWSKEEIDWRIRNGRFHPVHAGVYAVGHQVIPRQGRWMAAVLASGPEAVLSHWSAAHLWMIRPNGWTRIDVTVPHRSRSSKPIRRHISAVPEDENTASSPTASRSRT